MHLRAPLQAVAPWSRYLTACEGENRCRIGSSAEALGMRMSPNAYCGSSSANEGFPIAMATAHAQHNTLNLSTTMSTPSKIRRSQPAAASLLRFSFGRDVPSDGRASVGRTKNRQISANGRLEAIQERFAN